MDIREIAESEHDLWNEFVAGYPTGDLLQSFEWGIIKSRSGDWQPLRLMLLDDAQPRAAISILKRKLPKVDRSIFYAPRGPVGDLGDQSIMSSLLSGVREFASKNSAILLKIDPPVPVEDAAVDAGLRESGFLSLGDTTGFGGTQPKCVMQLRLDKDEDALMAGFKPKCRYNIRLAEKKGVTVREGDRSDLRTFYDLLLETAKRDRFLVRGFSYFETMWDVLNPTGLARLFLAEYEDEAVSGALCFYFGDRCWYTYGASSNSHRNVMPNHLMQWHMIRHARSIGCRIYDFRGVSPQKAPTPDDHLQGLNRFKEGFAAEYVEYIGEYDLPFSKPMYWLWTVAAPRAMAVMKGRKRLRIEE